MKPCHRCGSEMDVIQGGESFLKKDGSLWIMVRLNCRNSKCYITDWRECPAGKLLVWNEEEEVILHPACEIFERLWGGCLFVKDEEEVE